jgi:hypothetical protein
MIELALVTTASWLILCGHHVLQSSFMRLICFFSIVVVAVPYYILNMRAVVKLSKSKYFQKGPWIALIQQNMRLAKKRKLLNDDL